MPDSKPQKPASPPLTIEEIISNAARTSPNQLTDYESKFLNKIKTNAEFSNPSACQPVPYFKTATQSSEGIEVELSADDRRTFIAIKRACDFRAKCVEAIFRPGLENTKRRKAEKIAEDEKREQQRLEAERQREMNRLREEHLRRERAEEARLKAIRQAEVKRVARRRFAFKSAIATIILSLAAACLVKYDYIFPDAIWLISNKQPPWGNRRWR